MLRRDDRRDLGAIGLRELHGRRADGAGGAVDQDAVAGLEAERLQIRVGVQSALANHGLAEAQARRHRRDRRRFGHAEVFGMARRNRPGTSRRRDRPA